MENCNMMETGVIILDLLQKVERLTSPGDVTKSILGYRVIRDLRPNYNQDLSFALRLGGKAEEMFWSVDTPGLRLMMLSTPCATPRAPG